MGAVCYADDVALLAPSPSALRLILDTCRRVANSLSLFFNAAKTQLICFSSCASDTTSAPKFVFLGESLSLCNTVTHLGHILSHDLSDAPDIRVKAKYLAKKANYMLYSFSCCDQLQSFCLSLPGSATWKLSCLQLKSLEVTFNNTLRKVWSLPRKCHTSILHLTASLDSMYNLSIVDHSIFYKLLFPPHRSYYVTYSLRVRNWPSALLATITSLALGTGNITLNKTVSALTFYVRS